METRLKIGTHVELKINDRIGTVECIYEDAHGVKYYIACADANGSVFKGYFIAKDFIIIPDSA